MECYWLSGRVNDFGGRSLIIITSNPRATIAHLRVNKYSHWTFFFFFFFFNIFKGSLLHSQESNPAKIELIQSVIVILVTSKNEEYLIKIEGARVPTTLNIDFFRHSRAATSAVIDRIWLKFELIRDVMKVLVTATNEEDPIKIVDAIVVKTLNIIFSNTQGQLTPQSRDGSG